MSEMNGTQLLLEVGDEAFARRLSRLINDVIEANGGEPRNILFEWTQEMRADATVYRREVEDICKTVMNRRSSSSSSLEWNPDHTPWGGWPGNLPPEAHMYRSLHRPPPWAEVMEGDDEVLKRVQKLVLVQHAEHLATHSKLWSKNKQFQELNMFFKFPENKIADLEALVKELKQDITLKDRVLFEEGNDIEEMKDTIVDLEREVSQLEATKKLLEDTRSKLIDESEL